MGRFIETIRLHDGEWHNLSRHNRRMNATRKAVFGTSDLLDISEFVTALPSRGVHKCRIVYNRQILEVSFSPYTVRTVRSLRTVYSDTIRYRYKNADRSALEALFALRGSQDDVLIVRNGLLTDTSIANIALEKEGIWYTPKHPLLKGTQRARLLEEERLTECDIPADEIYSYSRIALFNAMIDFGLCILDINRRTVVTVPREKTT